MTRCRCGGATLGRWTSVGSSRRMRAVSQPREAFLEMASQVWRHDPNPNPDPDQ